MARKVEIKHEVWDLEGGRRVYLVIETSDFGIKSPKLPSHVLIQVHVYEDLNHERFVDDFFVQHPFQGQESYPSVQEGLEARLERRDG